MVTEDKGYMFLYYDGRQVYKMTPGTTLVRVCYEFVKRLRTIHCDDKVCDGVFVETRHPFTNEVLHKRYRLDIKFPMGVYMIKKLCRGSFDESQLLNTLKYLKENYEKF